MAQVSPVLSDADGDWTSIMWGVLDQVVSLVLQAIITWALVKILPNLYASFTQKKQSKPKSPALLVKCPPGLHKAKVTAPPPGLSLPEENSGSPMLCKDP